MNVKRHLTIVEDRRLFGECLISSLTAQHIFTQLDLALSYHDALSIVMEHPPDLMLIDYGLLDEAALELTRYISKEFPQVRIIILGVTEERGNILEYIEAGATAYLLKGSSLNDLLMAINLLITGETVCIAPVVHHLFSRSAYLARQQQDDGQNNHARLTSRELQILNLIAEGFSNKEIASRINLSLYTVKNHVHNILEKLQVQHRSEAVDNAYQRGWLKRGHT